MDSGIYKITFYTGHFYIGKSDNIPQRWKTHSRNFAQRTHTKKMQALYDQCGEPQYEVLLWVHPDHVDIYERVVIHGLWNELILNTTKPKALSQQEADRYMELYSQLTLDGTSVMLHPTLAHLQALEQTTQHLRETEQRLAQLEDAGVVLPHETQQRISSLEATIRSQRGELHRLQNLSLWDRLFYYKVYV